MPTDRVHDPSVNKHKRGVAWMKGTEGAAGSDYEALGDSRT